MQSKPVKQAVEAFDLELQIESWAKTSGTVQLMERPKAGPSKLLVDLLVGCAQLGINMTLDMRVIDPSSSEHQGTRR